MTKALRHVAIGEDGLARCSWCAGAEDYVRYHDDEWGRPVTDDRLLFEKLCLEGFQSGLSWLTILRKRDAFRRAFAGFDPAKVARFGRRDVTRLLADPAIVRHRGKIESTIGNARRALGLVEEFGSLASFVWSFEPTRRPRPSRAPTSPESVRMSKELRAMGWTFVGPTTLHAFMQAMGLINDHAEACAFRESAREARERLRWPPPRKAR